MVEKWYQVPGPRTLGILGHSKFTVIPFQRLSYQIHFKWLFWQGMVKKWERLQIPPGTLVTHGPVMTAMPLGGLELFIKEI